MKNLLKKYRHSEEGFTLIELIIVIAILAIIAAIAIPNIIGAVDDSRRTADIANGKVIANAAALAKAQNTGFETVTLDKVVLSAGATTDNKTKYMTAIYESLNSTLPTPKYNTSTYTDFYIYVDENKIEVYAGKGTTGTTMVYPRPASEYK